MSFDADVIVIGAGMAGLGCARALAERGQHVIVLEARDRVGGRVFSREIEGGQMVELGAEFIHGRAPELWALIDETGVETVERDGTMLREVSPGVVEQDDDRDEEFFAPLEALEDWNGEDMAFADWVVSSKAPEWRQQILTGYVEGFNAADARKIGIRSLGVQQKAEEESEGDRSWHVRGGYAQLTEYLARRVKELGSDVRLSCEVLAVRWREGHVELETSRCGLLTAPKCVVALPLGVLQRVNDEGGLRMAPEPQAVRQARRLEMGKVVRFTMVFREAWWHRAAVMDHEALEQMSFLFTLGEAPSVWWTPRPEPELFPTLTAWAGGPCADALLGRSAGELGHEACTALARVFGVREDLVRAAWVATYTHDWSGDQYACGAYSYVPAGALEASAAMAGPQVDTLFFAGEHTDTSGHWGTVHAALRTGLRAAAQVLGEP